MVMRMHGGPTHAGVRSTDGGRNALTGKFACYPVDRCIKERRMRVSRKSLLLGLVIAAGVVGAPTIASAGVFVDIGVAPPPPRVEVAPPPRAGYVWAPGFWEWRGNAHVWIPGRWMGERRGYHWAPDRWEQRGPHWHHERGHWER